MRTYDIKKCRMSSYYDLFAENAGYRAYAACFLTVRTGASFLSGMMQ